MKFEWDPDKSDKNKEKHGISFDEAKSLWNDPNGITLKANTSDGEIRLMLIAGTDGKVWAAIFTERDESTRIISVRRARKKEKRLYEENN